MTESSVRGAGRPRAGATDTTMLIWKVIAANPGITRAGIWAQVEHGIPDGYALRRYAKARHVGAESLAPTQARGYILTDALQTMRRDHAVSWEGDGAERRYTVAREIYYKGNAEAIDETGAKAADHMATAEAIRRVERLLATGSAVQKYGRKNCEAMALLVKALREKGSS